MLQYITVVLKCIALALKHTIWTVKHIVWVLAWLLKYATLTLIYIASTSIYIISNLCFSRSKAPHKPTYPQRGIGLESFQGVSCRPSSVPDSAVRLRCADDGVVRMFGYPADHDTLH